MKNKILISLAVIFSLSSQLALADDWTLQKKIRALQSQTVGQYLYIWTDGSWFPAGHRCHEKTVVAITPHSAGQEGFDQVFTQVVAAKVSGNEVKFGVSGDCTLGNAYFNVTHIQVF